MNVPKRFFSLRLFPLASVHNFHRATPFHRAALDASKKRKSPTRALRNFWRLTFVVLLGVLAILVSGLYSARVSRPPSPTQLYKRYAISSPFSFFALTLKAMRYS